MIIEWTGQQNTIDKPFGALWQSQPFTEEPPPTGGGSSPRIGVGTFFGNFKSGSTFDKKFTTRDANGVPVTLSGGVVGIYKNNTLGSSVAGITLTTNFDGIVGLHNVRCVLTDAFYASGSNCELVLLSGTVDGVSMAGEIICSFSIQHRFPSNTDVADETLKRDFSLVTGESPRSLLNAMRFLRNKVTIIGTAMSVKKEDDSTEAWAATVATTPGSQPITTVDPS